MTTSTRQRTAVPTAKLRYVCDPATVESAPILGGVLGQESALEAVLLGLEMSTNPYDLAHNNVAVVGSAHTGRQAKVLAFLRQRANGIECRPSDVLLLHNFADVRLPVHAMVPAGAGREIRKRVDFLAKYATEIVSLRAQILAKELPKQIRTLQIQLVAVMKEHAPADGLVCLDTEKGFKVVPMSITNPGEPMDDEEKQTVPLEVLAALDQKAVAIVKGYQEASQAAIQAANKEFLTKVIMAPIRVKIAELRVISDDANFHAYLTGLENMLIQVGMQTAQSVGEKQDEAEEPCTCGECDGDGDDDDKDGGIAKMLKSVTAVNTLVDSTDVEHPPVVHVTAARFAEMFGRISAQRLANDRIRVDHTMVTAGEILRANGTAENPGTLVVDAMDLLQGSGGWHSLTKLLRTIKTGTAQIESLYTHVLDETLNGFRCPEIPLHVRFVLICSQWVNYALRQNCPDFGNLFRVVAEFDSTMPIAQAPVYYKSFVEGCRASDPTLPKFSSAAVARLVEYGCRLADNQEDVSAACGLIKDVIAEAAHWAKKAQASEVGAEHVKKATKERFRRSTLWVKRAHKHLDDGGTLIDHSGGVVGQVNGLAVYGHSHEFAVGGPLRVSVRAYAGDSRVVVVQREAETSGPYTNIATGIIRGFLSGKYGAKKPIGVTLNICFEQCGQIDGDSATLAETIACISAITELPVNQSFAITGSMNQMGMAQPIGGINQKIEGHFGTLQRRGLLAGHGVVMPVQNLKDLVLDDDVVEAQRQGLYQVYAVTTLDEALELLLGKPAEEIHQLAKERLAKLGKEEKKSLWSRILRRK
jgi:predicted ATP-dependent protease